MRLVSRSGCTQTYRIAETSPPTNAMRHTITKQKQETQT